MERKQQGGGVLWPWGWSEPILTLGPTEVDLLIISCWLNCLLCSSGKVFLAKEFIKPPWGITSALVLPDCWLHSSRNKASHSKNIRPGREEWQISLQSWGVFKLTIWLCRKDFVQGVWIPSSLTACLSSFKSEAWSGYQLSSLFQLGLILTGYA